MTFRDLVTTSVGNLKRMKLRTSLTISGVIIAVGTFVAMLSFGAGNQQYVGEQFEKLGLLHTMQAFPISSKDVADSIKPRVLDTKAIEEISRLPGVRMVFPFDAFSAKISYADTQITMQAQALSKEALQTKWFAGLAAGSLFDQDSAKEAVVTARFLELFDIKSPDSLIGKTIVISVRKSSLDSGLAQLIPPDKEYLKQRFKEVRYESLFVKEYASKIARAELNHALGEFMDGVVNRRALVSDTLVVRGVMNSGGPRYRYMSPLLVPAGTAQRLSAGFSFDDPTALMAMLTSGNILNLNGETQSKSFPKVTIDVEPMTSHAALKDSIKALGFSSFSFSEQFEEIKKFFVYFDLALAVVGMIALVTASLGIINTLVMSVLERRREIGVMKSLGADERDIRNLFLTESGIIGFIGSVLGILLGWGVTRAVSFAGKTFMAREGLEQIELFALPIWLILVAIALGTTVSILAGLYPAARAARVDPVEALRSE